MNTFFEHISKDLDFRHWQIELEIAKLRVARYLAKELGAHEYDAWKAADRLEYKPECENLIKKLSREGLTKSEENGILECILNLEAVYAQRPKF